MTNEGDVTVRFKFWLFRRHVADEVTGLTNFMLERKDFYQVFINMWGQSKEGMCQSKCGACTKYIFGDQALGGFVMMESVEPVTEKQTLCTMAPVCRDCARGDVDILQTRAVNYIITAMGAHKFEVVE